MENNFLPTIIADDELWFPPIENADEDGLVALTFDFSIERIILAYQSGLFPWYQLDGLYHWFAPNPRCVIFPNELKVSKSMKKIIKDNVFEFSINTQFKKVMQECASISRKPVFMNGVLYENQGTWINNNYIKAYTALHKKKLAVSAETWLNGELVGGLYGVLLGKVFFGESMFSKTSNASKFAFIKLVEYLKTLDVQMIDCQQPTNHLISLGARSIAIKEFKQNLMNWVGAITL